MRGLRQGHLARWSPLPALASLAMAPACERRPNDFCGPRASSVRPPQPWVDPAGSHPLLPGRARPRGAPLQAPPPIRGCEVLTSQCGERVVCSQIRRPRLREDHCLCRSVYVLRIEDRNREIPGTPAPPHQVCLAQLQPSGLLQVVFQLPNYHQEEITNCFFSIKLLLAFLRTAPSQSRGCQGGPRRVGRVQEQACGGLRPDQQGGGEQGPLSPGGREQAGLLRLQEDGARVVSALRPTAPSSAWIPGGVSQGTPASQQGIGLCLGLGGTGHCPLLRGPSRAAPCLRAARARAGLGKQPAWPRRPPRGPRPPLARRMDPLLALGWTDS